MLDKFNELGGTQKSDFYEVSYKNLFNLEVVNLRVRLQYTYGGSENGRGKYLANVSLVPAEINETWGTLSTRA